MEVQILLFQVMLILTNKKLINKLLIGFRTGLGSILVHIFNRLIYSFGVLNEYQFQLELHLNYLFPMLLFCKKHSLFLFTFLMDLTCYEQLGTKFRYILLYSLLNIENSVRLRVKLKISEWNLQVLSVTSLFFSAGWLEREVFDFFGVFFFLNKDLRRILLDYGFKGYPLRKDFPLSGFLELCYDDITKKITYSNLVLSQEYRFFFKFKSSHEFLAKN